MSSEPVAAVSVSSAEKPDGVRIDNGGHALRGDEPASKGSGDTGPGPFGLVARRWSTDRPEVDG